VIFDDVFGELSAVSAYESRKRRAQEVAKAIHPAHVVALNNAADRWPYMTPDAAMGATRTNRTLANETFEMLGELSTKRWMRDHPAGIGYGQPLTTPQMRRARTRSANLRAQANQGINYATMQAQRGAEASQTKELRDLDLLTDEGELRSPVPLEELEAYSKQGVRLDPRIQKFREITEMLAGGQNGEWQEVPFVLPEGGAGRYRPPVEGGEGGFFRPEPGVEGANVLQALGRLGGRVGNIRLPQLQLPGAGPSPGELTRQTAGPSSVQDVVRTGSMAMDFPVQEAVGQFRNAYGWAHGKDVSWAEPQSDFLIQMQTGKEAGNGFLVDLESEVAKERRRREAERGQIHGHNISVGRWVADALPFAPDTKPWMLMSGIVDLGVQTADPTAAALGAAGKAGRARDLFANPELYEKAGLYAGLRRTFAGPDVAKALNSDRGARAVSWLTEHTDPYEIWAGLNRKVNNDVAVRLADTRSAADTRRILETELGKGGLRAPSTFYGAGIDPLTGQGLLHGTPVKRPKVMPIRGPIEADDGDLIGREIEAFLHNAGGTDEEIAKHVGGVMRAGKSRERLNASIRDALRATDGILARGGIDDPVLRSELTRLHASATEEGSKTWIDLTTAQRQTDDIINVGGDAVEDLPVRLYNEYAPKYLKLPDARRIRRLVSDHERTMMLVAKQSGEAKGELRWPIAALEAIQNEIWKPVMLATRIAWPIRVIGEEQVRMAVAGYDSMFNHPVSFLAGAIGKKKGEGIADNFLREAASQTGAITRAHGHWIERAVANGRRKTYTKGPHEARAYRRALASETARLANDPIASEVAKAESLDDVKEWFKRGAGQKFHGDLVKEDPRRFGTPEQADAYIEGVERRIRQQTGGHEDMLEAVRTGKFRGSSIIDEQGNLDKDVLKGIDEIIPEYGPAKIVGDEWHSLRDTQDLKGLVQSWDRTVDKAFGWLMTYETNWLSRVPTFSQSYWQEAERLLPHADEAAKQRAIATAERWIAGPDRRATVNRLKKITPASGPDAADYKAVDFLAKGHGLDRTKELLYDLSRRGRTMDALRVIFPFGEAWSEVITRWFGSGRAGQPLGLVWKNPKTIRRFQQLMQGARGEEFGEFAGTPMGVDPETGKPTGTGFFFPNQYGEEIFAWPGTDILTDKLLDVPIPLTGRVQGLSMFGTVMPGLGPVVQMPVGWFLQTKPGPQAFKEMLNDVLQWKPPVVGGFTGTVREQILPFGSVGAEDQSQIFSAWSYVPPYMKSLGQFVTNGDVNGKQWNQSVMEVMAAKKAEGGYGDSVEETNRLVDDSRKSARWFYLIKGLAGGVAPAAPDGEWMLETKNGQALRASALAEVLQTMREDDFDTADQRFMELYGPDVMTVLSTPMTTSTIYSVPTTSEGVAWVMANPGIEDKLPNVYGFFAPEGGEEDFTIYNDYFRKGEAIRLSPENWGRMLNHTKGNVAYRQYVEEVGDQENTKVGKAYLKMRREELWDQYPGWRDERGKLNKAPDRTFIDEAYRALDIPAIRRTDAGQGLAKYLEARDEVAAFAEREGYAWPGTSQAMLPGRLYLDERARDIIDEHPQFKKLYDYILSRETEELEEVAGAQGEG